MEFDTSSSHSTDKRRDLIFSGILIAAIGDNLIQIIVGSLIIGIVSVLIVPLVSGGNLEINSNALLRVR